MRHRVKTKKLSRTSEHRKAMLNNLVASLFEKSVVITTTAKAKEAKRLAEKLITMAKNEDSVHSRREVAKRIHSRELLKKLFTEIAPLYKTRNGGYTRVVSVGIRRGDGSSTSILELVEKPQDSVKEAAKKEAKKAAKKEAVKEPKAEKVKKATAKEKKTTEKKAVEKKTEKKTVKKAVKKEKTDD